MYEQLKTQIKDLLKQHAACICAGVFTVLIIGGICVALKVGFGPTIIWDRYGNVIVLTNKGEKALSDVVVSFAGGDCKLSVLPAQSNRILIMNLHGESPLSLSFTDAAGAKHGSAEEIYLEPGYKGSVDISIDSANKVIWKNNTEPFPAH
ncbi:MAG: hypothetical protein JST01_23740 [Cyanobacteria bacterium SZAS TMP-1]|nr:hypothetical protein [Cyanobacteria bacterium SZAS TMP-1]